MEQYIYETVASGFNIYTCTRKIRYSLEKIPGFLYSYCIFNRLANVDSTGIFWIKSLITRKTKCCFVEKNQAILFLFIAVIAGIYSASLLISELRNPPLYTNQLQLKLEVFRKSFVMLGVSFLFTFLSLWSLKVVFSLLIEKIRELVYLLKRTRIVKLP